MFDTFDKDMLISTIKHFLKNVKVDDELLLQIFCLVKFNATYVVDESWGFDNKKKELLGLVLFDEFCNTTLRDFIKKYIPTYVVDLENVFRKFIGVDDGIIANHIVAIRKSIRVDGTEILHNYDNYVRFLVSNQSKPVTEADYRELVFYVTTLEINAIEKRIQEKFNEKRIYKIADVLNNRLREPEKNQIEFICRCVVEKQCFSVDDFVTSHEKNIFCNITNEERINLLCEIRRIIWQCDPLDLLIMLENNKRTEYDARGKDGRLNIKVLTPEVNKKNDDLLECGVTYKFFKSAIMNTKVCTIVLTSANFIKKWLNDSDVEDTFAYFYVKNTWVRDLLNTYVNTPEYGMMRRNVRFVCADDYYKDTEYDSLIANSFQDYVLIFALQTGMESLEKFIKYCKVYMHKSRSKKVFVLSQDEKLKDFIENSDLIFENILLIPRGIKETLPGYKTLWQISISNKNTNKLQLVKANIYHCIKNYEERQCILFNSDPQIVDLNNLKGEESLRNLYKNAVQKRSLDDQRAAANCFHFTNEIDFWYSVSINPKKDKEARLSVYICQEPRDIKRYRQVERGKRIKDSEKTCRILPDKIQDYLEHEYPFATKKDAAKKVYSIQYIIAHEYQSRLRYQDITLKTLWYVYPELKERFAKKDYDILTKMALGDFGKIKLNEFDTEKVNSVFSEKADAISDKQLFERIVVLSKAINFGILKGHCSENNLELLLDDYKRHLRSYGHIRDSLVKKSFTNDEFCKLLEYVILQIRKGETLYLGVLIKMMTGLSSNVICALRWKDICNYDRSEHFYINVSRQLTNDGLQEKRFDKIESYRYIPCGSILENVLKYVKKNSAKSFADEQEEFVLSQFDGTNIAPRNVEKLAKNVITLLEIEDVTIEIPNYDEGTLETDLTHYYGDIFRSNYKYLSLKYAGLSADEMEFLLGNQGATTFGLHYCDFNNREAQLLLQKRISKIDEVFRSKIIGLDF